VTSASFTIPIGNRIWNSNLWSGFRFTVNFTSPRLHIKKLWFVVIYLSILRSILWIVTKHNILNMLNDVVMNPFCHKNHYDMIMQNRYYHKILVTFLRPILKYCNLIRLCCNFFCTVFVIFPSIFNFFHSSAVSCIIASPRNGSSSIILFLRTEGSVFEARINKYVRRG